MNNIQNFNKNEIKFRNRENNVENNNFKSFNINENKISPNIDRKIENKNLIKEVIDIEYKDKNNTNENLNINNEIQKKINEKQDALITNKNKNRNELKHRNILIKNFSCKDINKNKISFDSISNLDKKIENKELNRPVINIENINNNEIKIKNKNEIDLDSNLNINNIIENKQNNLQKNFNINIQKNYTKTDNNEKNQEQRIIKSNNSLKLEVKSISPQNINLFDDINIFDAILIILNHNTYIDNYIQNNSEKIYKSKEHNKYCLSIILFYINKYLWVKRPDKIIKEKIFKTEYKQFLDCYIKTNCKSLNPGLYLYDINNIELIINFIYYRINREITAENSSQIINIPQMDDINLYNFLKDFTKNNRSMISDFFSGSYKITTTCINCQNKCQRYGNIYFPYIEYIQFELITFNVGNNAQLNDIRRRSYSNLFDNYFNPGINNMNFGFNNNINNNLYKCFKNEFYQRNPSYCNSCNFNTEKYIEKKIYSPPIMLTIVLNNNDGTFIINDEIDISNFAYLKGNFNYLLVAMLCKYNYNDKFIIYCFNSKDSNWYSYKKEDGFFFNRNVRKATELDPNAIPYVIYYHKIEEKKFKYIPINLNINKKKYLFKFQNGLPQKTLFFELNITVKSAKKEISRFFDLKNPKFIINAQQPNDNNLLCSSLENASHILVISDN